MLKYDKSVQSKFQVFCFKNTMCPDILKYIDIFKFLFSFIQMYGMFMGKSYSSEVYNHTIIGTPLSML